MLLLLEFCQEIVLIFRLTRVDSRGEKSKFKSNLLNGSALFIFAILIFFFGTPDAKAFSLGAPSNQTEYRIYLLPLYESMNITLPDSSSSNFYGYGIAGALEWRHKLKNYGIGINLEFGKSYLGNSTEEVSQTERFRGTNYIVSLRLYVLNMFIAIGGRFSDLVLTASRGTSTRQFDYIAYGARVGLGMDFKLTGALDLVPRVTYDFETLRSFRGFSARSNSITFALGLSLGF